MWTPQGGTGRWKIVKFRVTSMLSMDTQLNRLLGLDSAIIYVFLLWWKSNHCTVTAPIAWIFFPFAVVANQSVWKTALQSSELFPAVLSQAVNLRREVCRRKTFQQINSNCARGTAPSVCVCVCATCKVCCQIHSLHSDSDRQTLCGCDARTHVGAHGRFRTQG